MRRPRGRALAGLIAVLASGCAASAPSDAEVISGWSDAVNAADYERAGSYFAAGAVVEQLVELRLPDQAAAARFSSGLPCRADVTEVRDEGSSSLASFRLRAGRSGTCAEGGLARVRFVIRGGKIAEWRQLPDPPPAPPGQMAVLHLGFDALPTSSPGGSPCQASAVA